MGWLDDWIYRKSHDLIGATGAGIDYQVKVKVHSGFGVDSEENVYLNNHCTDFPNDIRFTGDDGTTKLDYFVEDPSVDPVVVWIKVKGDLSSGTVTIYVYYGKSGAASESSGVDAFRLFDDFTGEIDPLKWVKREEYGTVSVPDAYCRVHAGDAYNKKVHVALVSKNEFNYPMAIIARMRLKHWDEYPTYAYQRIGTVTCPNPSYADPCAKVNYYPRTVNCGWDPRLWVNGTSEDGGSKPDEDVWFIAEVNIKSGDTECFRDGTSVRTNSETFVETEDYILFGIQWWAGWHKENLDVDWIAVRKYVSPEPTHGDWGGEEQEFLLPPTTSTVGTVVITPTSARLNGEVTSLYPSPCDRRGFEWGTESGIYPYSWTETDGFGIGSFNHVVTGLEEDTTYYFRAKAHNSEGWGYGGEKSFTPEFKVDLRLSDVAPPDPEPKRTIYRDIVNLPDPVLLGMTIRYFNHDDVGLYMQITGSCAGYTFGTVNLGLRGSGTSAYQNLDEFASRAKPSVGDLPDGEMEENITLILKAYTDAGYSDLKWTFERVVTVHWINSADAAFTVDELDNFDDGTVQDWAVTSEGYIPGWISIAAVSDYVLSTPYSCKMLYSGDVSGETGPYEVKDTLYKEFTTPNKGKVFAILDVRNACGGTTRFKEAKYLEIKRDDSVLVHIGTLYDTSAVAYIPLDKWMRIVVPLPKNTTLTVKIIVDFCLWNDEVSLRSVAVSTWLDDFKIISK